MATVRPMPLPAPVISAVLCSIIVSHLSFNRVKLMTLLKHKAALLQDQKKPSKERAKAPEAMARSNAVLPVSCFVPVVEWLKRLACRLSRESPESVSGSDRWLRPWSDEWK